MVSDPCISLDHSIRCSFFYWSVKHVIDMMYCIWNKSHIRYMHIFLKFRSKSLKAINFWSTGKVESVNCTNDSLGKRSFMKHGFFMRRNHCRNNSTLSALWACGELLTERCFRMFLNLSKSNIWSHPLKFDWIFFSLSHCRKHLVININQMLMIH